MILLPSLRRGVVTLGLIAVLGAAGCGGNDERDAVAPTAPDTGTSGGHEIGCREVAQPQAKDAEQADAPTERLDPAKEHRIEVETSCGTFTITLDPKAAPRAAASFAALAEEGFFDGTFFHRVVPGFVIQGGDPTGTGMGGPGYSTVDPPAASTRYTKGVVAMAKAGNEAAGTAGSQFFVVTAEDAMLPPEYAAIGKVTDGLGVVTKIGELGDPATEQPTQTVVIDEMRVTSD